MSLQGPQVMVRQLTNNKPSLVCFPWQYLIHLLQKSSQHFTNPTSTVIERLCLITKTTNSLDWSCGRRYFVFNSEGRNKDDEDDRGEDMCTGNSCGNFSQSKWWMNVNFGTMTKIQNQRSTKVYPLWLPTTNELNWTDVNRTKMKLTEVKWT